MGHTCAQTTRRCRFRDWAYGVAFVLSFSGGWSCTKSSPQKTLSDDEQSSMVIDIKDPVLSIFETNCDANKDKITPVLYAHYLGETLQDEICFTDVINNKNGMLNCAPGPFVIEQKNTIDALDKCWTFRTMPDYFVWHLIRFKETEVRSMGRTAAGVMGIRLYEGDYVVGMEVVPEDKDMLFVTQGGFGKRVRVADFRIAHRGGYGVRTIPTEGRNGPVIGLAIVDDSSNVLLIDIHGKIIRLSPKEIRTMGRQAKGVRLIRLEEDRHLAAISVFQGTPENNESSNHDSGNHDAANPGASDKDQLTDSNVPGSFSTLKPALSGMPEPMEEYADEDEELGLPEDEGPLEEPEFEDDSE